MLNAFGKFVRNLRMDRNELLKNMATKLDVTSSYLSAVELGKRAIPDNWSEKITDLYQLSNEEALGLRKAVDDSLEEIKVSLKDKSSEDRDLIISFARNLDNLEEETKERLFEIFGEMEG